MGYSTNINLKIIHQKRLTRKYERKAFADILEKSGIECSIYSDATVDNESCSFNDNNTKTLEQVIALSKKYPSLLMEASGMGEDNDDIWEMRIKNGQTEQYTAQIIYPQFNKLLTTEERANALWKASRRSKTTEGKHFDLRVTRALRQVEDLLRNPPACLQDQLNFRISDLLAAADVLEGIKRTMRA